MATFTTLVLKKAWQAYAINIPRNIQDRAC
jgi:hypothetical protein